jgi:hypothetical protein
MEGSPQMKRKLFFENDGESKTCSRTRDLSGRYTKEGIGLLETDRPAGGNRGRSVSTHCCDLPCGKGCVATDFSEGGWIFMRYTRSYGSHKSLSIGPYMSCIRVVGKSQSILRIVAHEGHDQVLGTNREFNLYIVSLLLGEPLDCFFVHVSPNAIGWRTSAPIGRVPGLTTRRVFASEI